MAPRRAAQPPSNVATAQAFVTSLGKLSPRQALLAADALRLAALLDVEEAGSAASALSRELRRVVAELTPAVAVVADAGSTRVRKDVVQKVQDEVARQRQRRGAS
jgi:hypothetical protein